MASAEETHTSQTSRGAAEGAEAQAAYWRQVDGHYRWNLSVNVLQGGFALLAMAVFMPETVLAAYMTTLTDSKFLIGLPWALSLFYWSFPALFYVRFLGRRRRRLRSAMLLSAFIRLAFMLMAVSAWAAPRYGASWAIAIFLLGEAILAATAGGAAMAWQDTLGRVLPPHKRAWSFGLRESFGHLSGFVASALLFWYLKDRGGQPSDYLVPFAVAVALHWVSWALFAATKEPEWPSQPRQEASWRRFYADTFRILKTNRNFRTYVFVKCLIASSAIFNFGLFASYAINRFGISKALVAGAFSGVALGARVLAAPVAGRIADRKGPRTVLLAGLVMVAVVLATGLSLEWLGPLALGGFFLIYTLNGAAATSMWLSEFNLLMEFGHVEDRPRYIAVAGVCAGPVAFAAAASSGYLVDVLGYRPVMLMAFLLVIVVWLVAFFIFKEPRSQAPPAQSD